MTTTTLLLLLALFTQVALTFALLFRLGPARVAALKRGDVQLKDVALGQKAWPDQITQISNAYANQFELPVLFYAAVLLALTMHVADVWLAAAAWLFVLSRLAHAAIYVGSNRISARFQAFVVGAFTLLAMWVWLAARLLIQGV